jgi:4-aminobutyrate aminotransferase/(S)-3-amino-2-methylpropionate transaminase
MPVENEPRGGRVTYPSRQPLGTLLPHVPIPPPGRASRRLSRRLAGAESRNVTHLSEAWPIFWQEAQGANVRDADGNVYVDLTAAFGAALIGHAHPALVSAVRTQAESLIHAMGDVHPAALKVELLERLCALAPWGDARGVLASTGSEAVEIALKTAQLATGRAGVLAFEGAYHGLTLGSLAATQRGHFRGPFERRLYGGVAFAPFPVSGEQVPEALSCVHDLLRRGAPGGDPIGTLIVEPVQGRAGARVPPEGFMAAVSEMAADSGALVIADEVLTGLGRCGATLASDRVGLSPDIVCLGKALGGGLPVSACLAPARIMDAWPPSGGEAIHTSTFLGHPLGCAAALAVLDVVEAEAVARTAASRGLALVGELRAQLDGLPRVASVRGLGLLVGIELASGEPMMPAPGAAARVAEAALRAGVLVLPAGSHAHVVELTPPAVVTEAQLSHAVRALARAVEEVA